MSSTLRDGHGEPQQWDGIWQAAEKRGDEVLFTKSQPQTLKELIQRSYFEDLWHWMGADAPKAKYLELGSGRGTTSMYLSEKSCHVTLVDLAENALALARENFAAYDLKEPTCILANAEQTGLPEESYDCIYNIGLLEHFEDPEPVIREASRLLKPGGTLFMVVVPHISKAKGFLSWLLFKPWFLITYPAKSIVKKLLGRRPAVSSMTRTDFGRKHYRNWALANGLSQVQCMAYNPYYFIYNRNPKWERYYQVPLLRLHHRLRRKFGWFPTLKTWPLVGRCMLLVGRKAPIEKNR